jgi:serine/threonine-protein kinase
MENHPRPPAADTDRSAGAIGATPEGQEPVDAWVGRTLGHFAIEARLGSGAMAAVYRAVDQILGRKVALKVLLPGADPVLRERFRQEARTISLLDHPNIVRTLQVGQTDGVTYIAMELVEGISLAELLGDYGKLSIGDSCRLLEPIARALAYAHRQGIIHRDVKPSNILLRRVAPSTFGATTIAPVDFFVTPLLSDFGVALALDSPELTAAGRTVGTPTYMAPEQAAGSREIDARADIYALGTVLYRCLVGRPPFTGSTTQILHAHVYEPLTIPDEAMRGLPPRLLTALQRALAKEPADRYANAAILAEDLTAIGGTRTGELHPADRTATLSTVSPAPPMPTSERVHVLVPAPGTRAANTRVFAKANTSAGSGSGSTASAAIPTGQLTARQRKQQRNWAALIFGTLFALLLLAAGVAILTTLLPVNRVLVRLLSPPRPVATATTPTIGPTAAPPVIALPTATTEPASPSLSSGAATATEAPPPTSGATPEAVTSTSNVADLTLYWENAVIDFEERNWNQARDNLSYYMTRADPAFRQAVESNPGKLAEVARRLLLDRPEAPFWAQSRALFDLARIEEMLFTINVGLATTDNTRGEPTSALGHWDQALAVRPSESQVQGLRNATARFLTAPEAMRERERNAMGTAHLDYANVLAAQADFCGAREQLRAAERLLNQDLPVQRVFYQAECEKRLAELAGQRLLPELSGAILYSTQVGDSYRIYRQRLQPGATPELLVADGAQPRLAPNGQDLAFRLTRGNPQGIGGVALTTAGNARLRETVYSTTAGDARLSPPSWSPDGGRLVFTGSRESDRRPRLYLKSIGDDAPERVLAPGQDPAWRPLGLNLIAYTGSDPDGGSAGLRLISDDGRNKYGLTTNERDRRPAWAPDARSLVFMSDGRDRNWEIYLLTLDANQQTSDLKRMTDHPSQDGLPTVDPSGNYIAFVSDRDNVWRIWVMPLQGDQEPAPVATIEGTLTSWLEHAIQWVPK